MDIFRKLISALTTTSFDLNAVNAENDSTAVTAIGSALGLVLAFAAHQLIAGDTAKTLPSLIASIVSFIVLLLAALGASLFQRQAAQALFPKLAHVSAVYWILTLIVILVLQGLVFDLRRYVINNPVFGSPGGNRWVLSVLFSLIALGIILLLDRDKFGTLARDRAAAGRYLVTVIWTTGVNSLLVRGFIFDGFPISLSGLKEMLPQL